MTKEELLDLTKEARERSNAIDLAIEVLGIETTYRSTYECSCGATWQDEWSCACDDECPDCGADISPTEWVVIDQDGNEVESNP